MIHYKIVNEIILLTEVYITHSSREHMWRVHVALLEDNTGTWSTEQESCAPHALLL